MYSFEYQRATDPKAAVAAINADSDAKFLAGGQSLLPTMRLRLAQPSQLIDVTRIPALKSISVDAGKVTVGAAVCHADVADHAELRRVLPALADLAAHIGDRQVRALGTIGGSLANTIQPPAIRQRRWRWMQPSSPIGGGLRRATSSSACMKRRWHRTS